MNNTTIANNTNTQATYDLNGNISVQNGGVAFDIGAGALRAINLKAILSGNGNITTSGIGPLYIQGINNTFTGNYILNCILCLPAGSPTATLGSGSIHIGSSGTFKIGSSKYISNLITGSGKLLALETTTLSNPNNTHTGDIIIGDLTASTSWNSVLEIYSLSPSGGNIYFYKPTNSPYLSSLRYVGSGHTSSRNINVSTALGYIDASGPGPLVLSAGANAGTVTTALRLTGSSTAINEIGPISGSNLSVIKTGIGTWRFNRNGSYGYSGFGQQLIVKQGTVIAGYGTGPSGPGVFGQGVSPWTLPMVGDSADGATGFAALLLGDPILYEGELSNIVINRSLNVATLGSGATQLAILGGANTSGISIFAYGQEIRIGRDVTLQAATGGTVLFGNVWQDSTGAGSPAYSYTIGTAGNLGTVWLSNPLATTSGSVSINYGTLQPGADDQIAYTTPVTIGTDTSSATLQLYDTAFGNNTSNSIALSSLTFIGSGSFVANSGTGALSMIDGTSSPALIQVNSGASHLISSNMVLINDTTINIEAGAILTISGDITPAGKILTKTGCGQLILSGINTATVINPECSSSSSSDSSSSSSSSTSSSSSAPLVFLTTNDETNTISFNSSGNWSDSLAPSSGKRYANYNYILRSPTTSTLSTVVITGTAGQFSCASSFLKVGQTVTISGTLGGTGSITGYSSPTTYVIGVTNGTTTFTLVTTGGAAIATTAGTPTGLTYTSSTFAGNSLTLGDGNSANSLAMYNTVTINSLTMNNTTIVNVGTAGSYSLNGNISVQYGGAVFDTGIAIGASAFRTLNLKAPLSGNGNITITNVGTLNIHSNNSAFTGNYAINSGTLSLPSGFPAATLGSGNVNIDSSGTFKITPSNTATLSNLITGSGKLIAAASGTVTLSNPNNTHTGEIVVGATTSPTSWNSVLEIYSLSPTGGNISFYKPAAGSNFSSLRYVGSGHTSSRNINMSTALGYIDASGPGPLVLSAGANAESITTTLRLTGSSTAINEIGAISGSNLSVIKTGTGTWRFGSVSSFGQQLIIKQGTIIAGVGTGGTGNGVFGSATILALLPMVGDSADGATGFAALLLGEPVLYEGELSNIVLSRSFQVAALGSGATQLAIVGGANTSGVSIFFANIAVGRDLTLQCATGGIVDFVCHYYDNFASYQNHAFSYDIGSAGNLGTVRLSNPLATTGGMVRINYGTLLPGFDNAIDFNTPVTIGTETSSGTLQLNEDETLYGNPNQSNSIALSSLTFIGSGSFVANSGTGALSMIDGTSSPALIQVNSGMSHLISSSMILINNTTINIEAGAILTISGDITPAGKILTKTGSGQLILSGTNTVTVINP